MPRLSAFLPASTRRFASRRRCHCMSTHILFSSPMQADKIISEASKLVSMGFTTASEFHAVRSCLKTIFESASRRMSAAAPSSFDKNKSCHSPIIAPVCLPPRALLHKMAMVTSATFPLCPFARIPPHAVLLFRRCLPHCLMFPETPAYPPTCPLAPPPLNTASAGNHLHIYGFQ